MKLIAISGKKQSGKSTIARIISLYKPNVKFLNFADPLKNEVALKTGRSVEYIEEHKEQFRTLLQGWGDYKKNVYGEDVWIKKWMEGYSYISTQHPASVVVCSDIRFLDEIKAIEQLGGEIWRVQRFGESIDSHRSEVALDGFPFEINILNEGTKEELAKRVKELLNKE